MSGNLREVLDEVVVSSHYDVDVFSAVYDKVKSMIVNKTFSLSNWITLVTLAMEVVEKVPQLHGIEKRNLVVDLVAKLVTEIPMSEDDRAAVSAIIRTTLPSIIDAIVQGTLGQIAVNIAEEVAEQTNKCLAKCQKKKA